MTKPTKFFKGEVVRSPVAAIAMILEGRWFYWSTDNRPKHPSVLVSMTIRTIEQAARKGLLTVAVRRGGYNATPD